MCIRDSLWKSDGTAEGTVLVKDLSEGTGDSYFESLTIFNDELYFITTSPDSNKKEIFKTDGTEEGTVQLTDIHENNGGVMGPLVEANGKIYFSAGDHDEYGRELWVTDGTESGTEMVVNLNDNATNNGDASVSRLFGDGDLIYFAAEDEHDNGHEPWVYDTTAPVSSTNPQMLMDVYSGQNNGITTSVTPFTKAGDSVIFFAQQDGFSNLDLYVTDGTPDGTSLLVDFGTGIGPGDFSGSITFNGEAYFAADIPSPNSQFNCTKDALWKTDGTVEGTVVVASCIVQEGNNNGATFIQTSNQLWSIVGDTLFFRAREYLEAPDEHYSVLWRTDGIPNGSGTYPVDLSYSNERCQLRIDNSNLFVLNNKIYTGQNEMCSTSTDNDYYNGTEIRVYNPTNITFGTPPLKYTFDFKLQVLEQLYPIFPSEDSADLAIDEPMVNITFQYDLKSAGTLVNQNIALAGRSTCAIVENGSVACWGSGSIYTLGNGGASDSGSPIFTAPMPDNRSVVAIAAGSYNVCALLENGSVACWGGLNWEGEMGDGEGNPDSSTKHIVPELTNVTGSELYATSISVAFTGACALLENGSVSCWGGNDWGQIGDNTTTDRFSPTQTFPFTDGKKAVAITSGRAHHCALLDDGTVSCWGHNNQGQIGDNTTTNRLLPTSTQSLGGPAIAISSNHDHTCAVLENGSLACWGRNDNGQIGTGSNLSLIHISEPTRPY